MDTTEEKVNKILEGVYTLFKEFEKKTSPTQDTPLSAEEANKDFADFKDKFVNICNEHNLDDADKYIEMLPTDYKEGEEPTFDDLNEKADQVYIAIYNLEINLTVSLLDEKFNLFKEAVNKPLLSAKEANEYFEQFREMFENICSEYNLNADKYTGMLPDNYEEREKPTLKNLNEKVDQIDKAINNLWINLIISPLVKKLYQFKEAVNKHLLSAEDANKDFKQFREMFKNICSKYDLDADNYNLPNNEKKPPLKNLNKDAQQIKKAINKLAQALYKKLSESDITSKEEQSEDEYEENDNDKQNNEQLNKIQNNLIKNRQKNEQKILKEKLLKQWNTNAIAEKAAEAAEKAKNEVLEAAGLQAEHNNIVKNASLERYDDFKQKIFNNFNNAKNFYTDAIGNSIANKLDANGDLSLQSCAMAKTIQKLDMFNIKGVSDAYNAKLKAIKSKIKEEQNALDKTVKQSEESAKQINQEEANSLLKQLDLLKEKAEEAKNMSNDSEDDFSTLFTQLTALQFLNKKATEL